MSQQMMQAIRVHQFGGPERLKLEQIACPMPREGEVLVQVCAAGVLPAEWKLRQGFFQGTIPVAFPYIPGSALAGIVTKVGPGVTAFQKGQAQAQERGIRAMKNTAALPFPSPHLLETIAHLMANRQIATVV